MADCPKCGRSNPAGTPMCRNCGQSLPPETAPDETAPAPDQPAGELDAEVLKLLQSGQKIAAIKLHRERTGVGLKEAKDAVEALATVPHPPAGDSDDEVLELLRSGQKIAAIKVHRERTGAGLKDSKEAVEALAAQHGIVPKPAGCAGVVLAAILLSGGLAAWVC